MQKPNLPLATKFIVLDSLGEAMDTYLLTDEWESEAIITNDHKPLRFNKETGRVVGEGGLADCWTVTDWTPELSEQAEARKAQTQKLLDSMGISL